ncbi:MAG: SUMF1/EgtB/PvdO family nonheme iron enzyme [Desulfobacteraceae bacterium]
MDTTSNSPCPQCGEPTRPRWRICPMCETRLNALTCPKCGSDVNEKWRYCPECEALLLCRQCGDRMMPGQDFCHRCKASQSDQREKRSILKDPVCGLEFVLVPGGTFAMGDTLGQGIENEKPVHAVALDDFYISRFPVTQSQWEVLVKENPSQFRHPDHPVEQVTWSDACDFARKLSQMAQEDLHVMLPTEAQWEYAARSSGKEDLYAGGDDIDAVAWYDANSQGTTQSVGKKRPNELGLHDMSGNVWEWCQDAYQADAYERHGHRNPVAAEATGTNHVIRGGSWNLDAWSARCARRLNFRADYFGPGLGFRLVMLTKSL